ncbi:MAG TPA: H-NS histone family protein [Terriglobales bacterium]|nr:H-NS histone family protein [Terriglobales bacterium]
MPDPQLSKLTKLSRPKLEALAQRAQRALEVLRQREVDSLVDTIRTQARDLGIDVADIVGRLSGGAAPARRGRPPAISPALAPAGAGAANGDESAGGARRGRGAGKRRTSKMRGMKIQPWFVNPATKEAWTGRGQVARWLADAFQQGHSVEEFLVDKSKREDAQRIQQKLEAKFGKGGRRGGARRKRGRGAAA